MSTRYLVHQSARKLLLAIMLVLLPGAPARSDELRDLPGDPKAGRLLFVKKGCIRCHSIWESRGKRGPNLASVGMGRNLYELSASIWSHWSQMSAALERGKEEWFILKPEEFGDIVAYIYYLNYYSEPGDAELGEQIFLRRGCGQCHAVEPLHASGKMGPAVYEMRDFQGSITLAAALWNHGSDILRGMIRQRIPWPQFQDKEVANLVAYIRSRNGSVLRSEMVLPGDPVRGQGLFISKSCADCHKVNAREKGVGPNLATSRTGASLSSLVGSLWNHYPRMAQAMALHRQSYPKVAPDEMADLLAFIYWLRSYGLKGNVSAGRDLYDSKQCASCHSPSPAKPAPASNLVGSKTTESAYALLAAIWNHGPKMEALLRERNLTWPKLSGQEMLDLMAFFRSSRKSR